MSYKVEYDKKVKKFLLKCDDYIFEAFQNKVDELSKNPYSNSLDIKKLKNRNGYRLRIGKYRFLYEIFEDKILIYFFNADSRGDVY